MNDKIEMLKKQQPLRVLYVISRFELGGAEKYVFELSWFLAESVESAIVSVLGNDKSIVGQSLTQEANKRGVVIFNGISFPWKFGGFLVSAFKLRKTIKDFDPDIIHLNTEVPEFSYALCTLLDKSIRQIPVIRTIHNTVLWMQWDKLGAWCEKQLADAPVVYVSQAVKNSFKVWRKQCAIPTVSNEAIIYNPISVSVERKTLLNSRILEKREIKLLFAGRFEYQKGCDLLAEILMNTKVPIDKQLTLQIYGEGSNYELLENLQKNPPKGWNIRIAPPIPNLVEVLSEYDILLFPSRFEGYGRMAAEAVLSGIPVIAFRLQVLMEVFPEDYPWLTASAEEDVAGFANNLSELLASLDQAQNTIDNAREQLKDKLDQRKIALASLNVYQQVLENNRYVKQGKA